MATEKEEGMNIIIDSREQDPFAFRVAGDVAGFSIKGLKTGDYSIEGMEHLIAIERKSIPDLIQTLGRGNERFQRELKRGLNLECFVLLVEGCFSELKGGWHHSKIPPHVVEKILWTLMHKYGIQVMFAPNKSIATSMARGILTSFWRSKQKKTTPYLGQDMEKIKMVNRLRRKLKVR